MGKPRYDPPTNTFPYKISKRLNLLSVPTPYFGDDGSEVHAYTPRGIRVSALRGHATDRINDAAWPYIRRLVNLKKQYKNKFSPERLERIDRMIEMANATMYTKLANCALDLKKQDTKDVKKKRAWTESEWKKHMDYIGQIAGPKKDFKPPPVQRGPRKPLDELLPRIDEIASRPAFKVYKRLSKETWYRDPEKVSPAALKYQLTERTKALAVARVIKDQY